MPVSFSALAAATVGLLLGAQDPPPPDLPPNPFRINAEALDSGNPLAGYLELLALEASYRDAGQQQLYFEALATRGSFLGDTQGALRSWAEIHRTRPSPGPIQSSPLDDYTPADAVSVVLKKAEKHRVIMLGEEHVQPQTRSILLPLLRELRQLGFRYFAVETFNADLERTLELGYTTRGTGFYTREPVFAEAVNEAIRLGYTLVPYENTEPPSEQRPDDPMYGQNHRERGQAVNLKTRIFDVDPAAKVLVWAGRSHVCEETGEVPGVGTLEPMGYHFRELTGLDPFTMYLPSGAEQADRAYEFSDYRYATHHGWVDVPTIFVHSDGSTYGRSGDAAVFFPRTTLERGRPDWLARELGRVAVRIPGELVVESGHQLVQAFHVDNFREAIPLDQVVIAPGDPVPVLMLPPGRTYFVRGIDRDGVVRGPVEVPVPE